MIRIFDSICCRKSLVVLAYHSVSDGLTPISVKTEEFRRQMQYLKDAGFKAIGLKDYIEIIENKKNISGKKVLITFDDGHKDVYENALPILKEFNSPAVLSVNPAYVGKKAEFASREKDKERDICSLAEIRELVKNGFSVINHGFNHKDFTKLSEKEIVFEYEEAKKWIADNIKTNCFPDIFVFPKNSCDKNSEAFLKKRGARLIFGERVNVYPGKSINYFALNLNRFFRWLRKNKLWIIAVFCVLAIKVILGILLLNNIPNTGLPADFFIFTGGDDIDYVYAGRYILNGDFLTGFGLVGYSIFIAIVMAITGKTALPAIAFPLVFANVFIFSTAIAVLSMLIVKKFWSKISYALFAGLSVIALPYLWFFLMKDIVLITASGVVDKVGFGRALQFFGLAINSDWFSAFLACLGIWLFLNANYGYSGLFFGLSFLVRVQNALFLLFLFALLIFSRKIKESLSFGAGGFIGGFLQLYLNYRMTGSPFKFAGYYNYIPNILDEHISFLNILNLPMRIMDKAPYLLVPLLLFIVISVLSLKYFYKNREKFYFLLTYGIVMPVVLIAIASSIRNPRYFFPFIPIFLMFLISSYEVLFLKKKSYNSS